MNFFGTDAVVRVCNMSHHLEKGCETELREGLEIDMLTRRLECSRARWSQRRSRDVPPHETAKVSLDTQHVPQQSILSPVKRLVEAMQTTQS